MQIFNFNKKNHLHEEMCAVELYMTIISMYDAIIPRYGRLKRLKVISAINYSLS